MSFSEFVSVEDQKHLTVLKLWHTTSAFQLCVRKVAYFYCISLLSQLFITSILGSLQVSVCVTALKVQCVEFSDI